MTRPQFQQFRQNDTIEKVCVTTAEDTSSAGSPSSCYVSIEDIRDVFSHAVRFKLNGDPIQFLRDTSGKRFEPLRIAVYPDDILEVVADVSPSTITNTIVHSPAIMELDIQSSRQTPSQSSNTLQPFDSLNVSGDLEQAIMVKSNLPQELRAIKTQMEKSNENSQQFANLLNKLLAMQVEAEEKEDKMLALQLEAKANSEKVILMQNQMLDLQNQTLDRLAILQKHARAILVQNFELHEYPIPRLFIILPIDKSKWDPTRILENKFRIHFLCECGDYTIEASKSCENLVHLAKHDGYEIKDGTEFFKKYGKYMLILMRGLKMGMQSVNISMPHIPVTKLVDAGIDYSISYMEALSVDNPVLDSTNTADDYEGLEGADLRQLDKFLQINDQDRKLGNLYRITTESGHVKWVCIDHYRATYKEKEQQAFVDIVKMNDGTYDEELGRLVISLRSRIRAQEFFDALSKARHVYGLDVTFGWKCSTSDLEALENALKVSNVSVLRLDLQHFQESLTRKLLPANTILTTWNLEHSSITNEGALALSEVLKTNTTLTTLNLGWNSIENEGALALSEALKTNCTLTTLALESNFIGNEGALALSEALETNTILTALDLRGNPIGRLGALALTQALEINATLTNLSLWHNSIGNEKSLALSEALKTNTTLTTLNLKSNSIGNEGALALSEALKTNATLTSLNLEWSSIGNEGVLTLSEALKINSTLTDLDLQSNSIGKEGALALSEALKINTTLSTLDLGYNSIGNEGALALSEALKINTTLTTLDLTSNSIGKEGALAISEALKTNTTLSTLDLTSNLIGKEGAFALSEALKTNTILTTLDLKWDFIEKEGALALSEALKTNTTLTTLNLGYNSIGKEGALALSEALKTNATLTTLDLGNNSIGKEGALAISEALKTNTTTLTTLNLKDNSIGKEGVLALSETLKTNTTLTTLDLKWNFIGKEGALALSEALKTNTTLTTLNLIYNSIGNEGALALSEALKTNITLTTLNLRWNSIEKEGTLALSKALMYNSNLSITQ
ncbi:hypothetical protein BGZ49_000548 [Haplosporangium sp. Z 27]|nr:hypothetical protein BGZ49_000548 [Haplosporangium sp. Z 27]